VGIERLAEHEVRPGRRRRAATPRRQPPARERLVVGQLTTSGDAPVLDPQVGLGEGASACPLEGGRHPRLGENLHGAGP
jgi:hypothetical protein